MSGEGVQQVSNTPVESDPRYGSDEPTNTSGMLDDHAGTSDTIDAAERISGAGSRSVPLISSSVRGVSVDGKVPRWRSRADNGLEVQSPDERLMRVLEHAAPADLPRVSIIGVETALEAMANASKLAIAADLDCWLDWCAGEHRIPCPAEPEHIVRYLRALEADGKKPATLARRVASLATVHRMLGAESDLPTAAPMVRNALRANRRRQGAAQRQAAPLRFGGALGTAAGFTITAMLEVCIGELQGMRDAALLSVGYDAGLRVGELVAVEIKDIRPQSDGSGAALSAALEDRSGRGRCLGLGLVVARHDAPGGGLAKGKRDQRRRVVPPGRDRPAPCARERACR